MCCKQKKKPRLEEGFTTWCRVLWHSRTIFFGEKSNLKFKLLQFQNAINPKRL